MSASKDADSSFKMGASSFGLKTKSRHVADLGAVDSDETPSLNSNLAKEFDYEKFSKIDGSHPLKVAVPAACLEYAVRSRPGGRVAYFNFDLAIEMGLIPEGHPLVITPNLEKTILNTFALQIINEHDERSGKVFDPATIRKNRYMATRYLQLQHPNKQGKTSGDGRSIWNGIVENKGKYWDISSCGTGATCLSPATAIHKKFFRTGDPWVAYGCGYATLSEGFNAALMSEIFYKNAVPTERTLALIEFGNNSINVRAAPNLLRPSHMFRFLKLGDRENLEKICDYYIDREQKNGRLPWVRSKSARYNEFLNKLAEDFAKSSAIFETEYIFCWMDWDGDNILASGAGIIDYGSVRQFGLYHKEYRYDDVDRFSTTIGEQKLKARYTVQTFAQLVDYVLTGKRKPISKFKDHDSLKKFNTAFLDYRRQLLLGKIGLSCSVGSKILRTQKRLVKEFEKSFRFFEERQSKRGKYETSDGLTSDAVFSMRDLLRELPKHMMANPEPLSAKEFVGLAASSYASPKDLKLGFKILYHSKRFQIKYREIIKSAARISKKEFDPMLVEVLMRSSIKNPYARITGDGIIRVSDYVLRKRKEMGVSELLSIISEFYKSQRADFLESLSGTPRIKKIASETSRHVLKLVSIVQENRESL